jgi:hypothetical protein
MPPKWLRTWDELLNKAPLSVFNYQMEMDPVDVQNRIQQALPRMVNLNAEEIAHIDVGNEIMDIITRGPQRRVFTVPVGRLTPEEIEAHIRALVPPLTHPTLNLHFERRTVMFGMFYPLDKQLELGNTLGK